MRSGECVPYTVAKVLDIFFEAVGEFNMRQMHPYTRMYSFREALAFFRQRVPETIKSAKVDTLSLPARSCDVELHPRRSEEPDDPTQSKYPQICFRLQHSSICINIFAVLYSNVIEPQVHVKGDHIFLKFFFMEMDWRNGIGIETFGVKRPSESVFRDRIRGEDVGPEYREELWHARCLLPPEFVLPIHSFNDF